jgi:hypothetical protein
MRIRTQAIILLLFAVSACANIGRFNRVMNPEELSKDELKKMPYETTSKYGFKVSVQSDVPGQENLILQNVDEQFTEFSECFNIQDGGMEARKYPIAVVNGTFGCEYHNNRCNGEYDTEYHLLIVTYKAFNRRGILPLLKHEWAHIYGLLRNDHSNLHEVQKCSKY